ncbi:MAG: hypothetical protein Q9M19_01315 [Mariprofundaceae bacterium]|nr:hypothetical protein [Mariprofundaceae bacterium]
MSIHNLSDVRRDLKNLGGGDGGSNMVDERLRHLESDVAVIKATMLTKDEFNQAYIVIKNDINTSHTSLKNDINTSHMSLIKWMVGTALAIVSVIGGLMIGIANILAKALGQ